MRFEKQFVYKWQFIRCKGETSEREEGDKGVDQQLCVKLVVTIGQNDGH